MKKLQILKAARIAHIAVWTIIALLVIVRTCKVWWANGCGEANLIAAIAFYGSYCAGICISGHLQFNEKIKATEDELKAQQPQPEKRIRKRVF